jgi:hypothetical protein
VLADLTGRRPGLAPAGLSAHLHAAVDWLLHAQAQLANGALPAYYDLVRGSWGEPYPETTGYTVPTLLTYAQRYGRPDVRMAALRMAEYLLSAQLADGSFPGYRLPHGVGFDTGQILFGLLAAHAATGDERFAHAAQWAGEWLVRTQQSAGFWQDYHRRNSVRAIDARTAWALLRLWQETGEEPYRRAACRQLDWALAQQEPNGWFRDCTFDARKAPVVHTLAYTTEGLLEAGLLLADDRYLAASRTATEALRRCQRPDGAMAGAYDSFWRPAAGWSCLTGNVQMACVWLRLHGAEPGDVQYLAAARRAIAFVAGTQAGAGAGPALRGAVKGSQPVWGEYLPKCPNWAAKFLVDALLGLDGDSPGVCPEQPAGV